MTGAADDLDTTCIFERIVAGVDGREGGRDALALAALLRDVCDAQLTAVSVYTFDRSVPLDDADAIEAVLHEDLLAELEHEVAKAGVTARAVVIHDAAPARALQAFAERCDADLIVVGAPHRAGADRILGGDVAAGTLRGAECAVAVAPAGFAQTGRSLAEVGVGFDGSPESREALRLGGRLARAAGAALRVVSVASGTVPEYEAAARAEGGSYEVVAGTPGRRAGPPQLRPRRSSSWARAGMAPCAGCCSAAPRRGSSARRAARCSSFRAPSSPRSATRRPRRRTPAP